MIYALGVVRALGGSVTLLLLGYTGQSSPVAVTTLVEVTNGATHDVCVGSLLLTWEFGFADLADCGCLLC